MGSNLPPVEDADDGSVASSNGFTEDDFHQDEDSRDKQPDLARRETKAVCGLRFLVFGVLICSMTTVAVLVFLSLRDAEQDAFEEQFQEDATKVLASLGLSLDLTLGGLDAFVVNMIAEAKASNQPWPFVTVSQCVFFREDLPEFN